MRNSYSTETRHLSRRQCTCLVRTQDRHAPEGFNSSQIFDQHGALRHTAGDDGQREGDTDG
jgi:hypothetical protein